MTRLRGRFVLAAFAVGLIGCSVPSTIPTVGPTVPTTASAAPTIPAAAVDLPRAMNPKVVIKPAGILVDGETVRVAVSGLWGKVFLSECATAASASSGGCGPQLAAQPFLITDDSGTGFASFVVRGTAASTQLGTQLQSCVAQCVLVATLGYGYGYATAPLRIGIP
jgi:hypothetical protein